MKYFLYTFEKVHKIQLSSFGSPYVQGIVFKMLIIAVETPISV